MLLHETCFMMLQFFFRLQVDLLKAFFFSAMAGRWSSDDAPTGTSQASNHYSRAAAAAKPPAAAAAAKPGAPAAAGPAAAKPAAAKKFSTPGGPSKRRRKEARVDQEVKNVLRQGRNLPVSEAPLSQQIRWEAGLREAEAVRAKAAAQIEAEAMIHDRNLRASTAANVTPLAPTYLPPTHGAVVVTPDAAARGMHFGTIQGCSLIGYGSQAAKAGRPVWVTGLPSKAAVPAPPPPPPAAPPLPAAPPKAAATAARKVAPAAAVIPPPPAAPPLPAAPPKAAPAAPSPAASPAAIEALRQLQKAAAPQAAKPEPPGSWEIPGRIGRDGHTRHPTITADTKLPYPDYQPLTPPSPPLKSVSKWPAPRGLIDDLVNFKLLLKTVALIYPHWSQLLGGEVASSGKMMNCVCCLKLLLKTVTWIISLPKSLGSAIAKSTSTSSAAGIAKSTSTSIAGIAK